MTKVQAKNDALKPANGPIMEIHDQKDGRTRIRVQFDITYKGSKGVQIEGESMTEPDLTMTLSQLLERHSRGKEIPMRAPVFFQTEIPTFSDLTDIERYRDQLKRRLDETNEFITKEVEAEKARKKEAEKESKKKAARQNKKLDIEDVIRDVEDDE
jgi:hypothetical protein